MIWGRKETEGKTGIWSKEWIYSMVACYYGKQNIQKLIQRTKWNKPFLVLDNGKQAYFNYSHTKKYLLAGFSEDADVGVDIEEIKRGHRSVNLITECLASEERKYMKTLDKSKQREALLKIWVQKEAIGKALGIGLIYDTSSFVARYKADVHRESFQIAFGNRELIGQVWREDDFWACVTQAYRIKQKTGALGKEKGRQEY
ncbi:4'-phosphopantetheinyl transferase family protein [[Clostridium] polysaccharolyticum]|uniref:4'-phosphopantetheinyl transferase family protein n=1 Tax=[Clostridium] polysaccharolyticum TaxID=29364 RepID=UPI0015A50164|nr:4'-phosphopantetheinyl transferase superfamily protein [[Clostridium] polysaccharolyticum]